MERGTRYLVAILVVFLTGSRLEAGVRVVEEAAHQGVYGLRAEVRAACPGEESALVLGPVVTDQRIEVCKELVVGAEVLGGGRLEAIAGERVAFTSGFRVDQGGRLVAGVSGRWDPGYVMDRTPASLPRLVIRWSVRFDGVSLGAGQGLVALRLDSASVPRGWVHYREGDAGGHLWLEVQEESGVRKTSVEVWLAPGWHRLELGWDAGSAISADGRVRLVVDGSLVDELVGLGLNTALVEGVDVGVVTAEADGGWVDVDDYETVVE